MKRLLRRTHALLKKAVAGKELAELADLRRKPAAQQRKPAEPAKKSKQNLADPAARKDEQIASLTELRDVYRAQIANLNADHTALTNYHMRLQEDFRALQSHYQVARTFLRGKHWLRQVVADVASLNEHSSLTPGRSDWAEKWRNPPGKRILYYAPCDHHGALYRWAEAVNRHTGHAARVVTLSRHERGLPLDILYFRADAMIRNVPQMYEGLCRLTAEADLVHLKGNRSLAGGKAELPLSTFAQFDKPLVYTPDEESLQPADDESGGRHAPSLRAVAATTPGSWSMRKGSAFIPNAVDTDALACRWADGKTLAYAAVPSSSARQEHFRAASKRLAEEFGMTLEAAVGSARPGADLSRATLFVDASALDLRQWYGDQAIVAGAFGIPTVTSLSPEAIGKAKEAGFDAIADCPFLKTEPTEDGFYRMMRDFLAASEDVRRQTSERTREWIEANHSYRAVAARLDRLYRGI